MIEFDPINGKHIPNRDQLSEKSLKFAISLGDINTCPICGNRIAYRPGAFNKTCSAACRSEYMKKISPQTTEKRKIIATERGYYISEEGQQKRVTAIKKNWEDPIKREFYMDTFRKGMIEKYGTEYALRVPQIKEQREQSLENRFGLRNWTPFLRPEVQTISKETRLQRYGDEYYNNRIKYKETCVQRYGVENSGGIPSSIEKIKQTNLKKYGAEWNFSVPDKTKLKENVIDKYGVFPWNKWPQEKVERCFELAKRKLSDTAIAEQLNLDRTVVSGYLRSNGYDPGNISYPESIVIDFVRSNYKGKIDIHNRKVINPLEIDIFLPSLGLGIEVNGEYWHNEVSNDDKLHIHNKWKIAIEKGIFIMNLNSLEILNREQQVKNFLLSKISPGVTYYARQCLVKTIDNQIATAFINSHHIQPVKCINKNEKVYGLYYKDSLLAVMLFGIHHRKGGDITLKRYCCEYNTNIVGGASKLFKNAVKENGWKHVITWSDNRFSDGNMYLQLGFLLSEQLPPDYCYWDSKNNKIISKQQCTKKQLQCNSNQAERERALELGLYRIWDCGKKRWEFCI